MPPSSARLVFFACLLKSRIQTFVTDFFVIPDHLISVDIVLGHDVLQQGDFKINKSGVDLIEAETSTLHSAAYFCIPVTPHVPTEIKSPEKCDVNFEFNSDFSSTSKNENLNNVDEFNSLNTYNGCEKNYFITPFPDHNNHTYLNKCY